MDNRTNKRNTFRPGNLLIASAALLLMMVLSMTSARLLVTIRKVTFGSEQKLEYLFLMILPGAPILQTMAWPATIYSP
jgi:hypothetical protein